MSARSARRAGVQPHAAPSPPWPADRARGLRARARDRALALFRWADGASRERAGPPPPSTLVAPPPSPTAEHVGCSRLRRLPACCRATSTSATSQRRSSRCSARQRPFVRCGVGRRRADRSQNAGSSVIPASNRSSSSPRSHSTCSAPTFGYTTEVAAAAHRSAASSTATSISSAAATRSCRRSGTRRRTSSGTRSPRRHRSTRWPTRSRAGVTRSTGDVVGDGTATTTSSSRPVGARGRRARGRPVRRAARQRRRVLGEDQRADDPNAGAAREFSACSRPRHRRRRGRVRPRRAGADDRLGRFGAD